VSGLTQILVEAALESGVAIWYKGFDGGRAFENAFCRLPLRTGLPEKR